MRVATRLGITAAVSVTVVALIGAALAFATLTVRRELAKNQSADEILNAVTGIRYLTMEYVVQHEQRPLVQLHLRQASLSQLLVLNPPFDSGADDETLNRIRNTDATVQSLFARLVVSHEQPRANGRDTDIREELEARLTGQIMIRLEDMMADAFTLSDRSRTRVLAAQHREDLAVGVFGGMILLIVAATMFVALTGILRPLARLRAGTAIVGAGQLDFRLDEGRTDEIGELARAFNEMTARLRGREEALARMQADLAHVSRTTSLGVLTASIAHEVNQPLSGIITNASTCLRMLATEPPNVDGARETVRRTLRDGKRAADVISRLRALFEKKGATTEAVNLNEATREVITLLSGELRRSGMQLTQELAHDLPPITGDRVQLQQVILNLLLNASDAMSAADEDRRLATIRTEVDDEDRVRLTVRDSGTGLDPEMMERLFDSFYTTKSGGMGIGLSVSRTIIVSHRGRIWAERNEGDGATFSFTLPRRLESDRALRGAAITSRS